LIERLFLVLDQYYLENIDQIKTISEPTRWRMLSLLIAEAMTGAQLARKLKIRRPLAHYHLKTLEKAGLIAFQEERTRNGMIEKYYRAIAKQYLTDRLIARGREMPRTNEFAQQAVEAMSEITRAMLELANADVSQVEHFESLLKYGFNFQDEIYLTSEEVTEFKQEFRGLIARLMKADNANRLAAGAEELVHLRYTLLLTPAAAFDFSPSVETSRDGAKSQASQPA
jgi:DNA-binding transcriptional ArsR family regulator